MSWPEKSKRGCIRLLEARSVRPESVLPADRLLDLVHAGRPGVEEKCSEIRKETAEEILFDLDPLLRRGKKRRVEKRLGDGRSRFLDPRRFSPFKNPEGILGIQLLERRRDRVVSEDKQPAELRPADGRPRLRPS